MDSLNQQRHIFAELFFLSNKLQTTLDRIFASEGITAKQLFLTIVLQQFGGKAPTMTELAAAMGTSHQNVKQIALKLEKKGFIVMTRDENDKRSLRLRLTEKSTVFWANRVEEGNAFLAELFHSHTEREIDSLYKGLRKLSNTLSQTE